MIHFFSVLLINLFARISKAPCYPGGGGGGGTLIFSYIHRLGTFFLVQNFEFQYFFWFFRKINTFLGYEDFVDIFWGSSQNWTIFRGYFYAF